MKDDIRNIISVSSFIIVARVVLDALDVALVAFPQIENSVERARVGRFHGSVRAICDNYRAGAPSLDGYTDKMFDAVIKLILDYLKMD